MSSLHISILCILLTIIIVDNKTLYFTKSNYELWCQENILSNSLFVYPNRIPIGIYRTLEIKSVTYYLINDNNNGLFQIKTRRLADFYFLIINITRPFDINREYQDVYILNIEANILTTQENQTEQTEIRLYIADSNDNDGVFDMDIYEQNYTQSIETDQSLIRFHASDADEIQHAQILYELASSLNETFSLHPLTGELYLITKENLKLTYQFDIYAYDRYRKRLVDNNMKTKTHVKLNFNKLNIQKKSFQTIFNQIIEFNEYISLYDINIYEKKDFNLLNIHQPLITIDIKSNEKNFEIFLLNNSSLNTQNLFQYKNNFYLNKYLIEEYNFQLFICFNNKSQCQYKTYRLIPSIDFNLYKFHFEKINKIYLNDNLPVDSFITQMKINYQNIYSNNFLIINYKLLNDEKYFQFYINSKTGILRLAEKLEYQIYTLDIQANIQLFNRRYSIETTIEINVKEINKYRPHFHNNTPNELFQLPYQFQAFDFDKNKQTNGRITYRLSNCQKSCPFIIDPNNGTLNLYKKDNQIYYLEIIAFDWGVPISLESRINIRIDLSTKLNKRDLTRTRAYSRRWKKKSTVNLLTTTNKNLLHSSTTLSPNMDTVYLNIGFRENLTSYYLSEGAEMNTIIDYLKIEYDLFPLNLNDEKDNLFFYMINDTNIPFIIDQNKRLIKLIDKIDREKQNKYVFEIELKLKSIYSLKLQEIYLCQQNNSFINYQYTNKYYQKMLVIIYITDINDNIPICNQFHANIQLNENQIEKNIFQIQAYDPDLGENGTISYSLFNYQQYFFINPLTGEIDCIKSIDREEYSFIELYIIASDQGSQPQFQSICTTLHITINDINDNIPQFLSNNYQFDLFSDMPRYSIFGQIYGIDADENDKIIYSLSPNPYITINKYQGYLRLKHNLHRLIDQILNVTVYISDGLHKNQTSIHIYIKAFPDAQEPILLSEPAYGVTINESLSKDSIITNVYRRFQILSSTIDFIELIHDDDDKIKLPFSIDQQGYLRLTDSLIGLSKSSYWISIRMTRYRAHPPQTFVHIHLSIRQENYYLPQCVDLYQSVKVYDYSIQHPFVHIQAITSNKNSHIQYSIDNNEKIFSINKQTGFINLLPSIQNSRRLKSDYLLTIKALDTQYKLSVNCYLNIHLIRRRELIPKFLVSSIYKIDLPEIQANSGRLRQRLFQIVALLDKNVYNKKLEIRYRLVDSNQHFIINRQTGYIAAKQPLNAYTTYEFNVEAFTVAYRDEILPDENEEDEHSNRGKLKIVSSRVNLPIKLRILPLISLNKSLSSTIDSTINIDLSLTTEIGSIILQLGLNKQFNNTQWFIMIGHIRYTRYFHVDFQIGHLILIRPIEELINQTSLIELYINVTNNWINMNTIKVIIHLIDNRIPPIKFSQNDYYSSVSKTIPIGVEIAHLTIENPSNDCVYSINRIDRIKSKDLFHINPHSGSITIINSLENSLNQNHLLTIIYRCEHNFYITSTNLHINILDEKNLFNQTNKSSFRFSQENYLIIFESSLIKNQKKYLINFELINDEGIKIKPQTKIIQGDPLGLFSIDSSNQSLILLDESLSRSYIYPINLTIVDISQITPINSTVIIFISNIGIQFSCPDYIKNSPFLFTYESIPSKSIDTLTGQEYKSYNSLTIRAFDPFTPLNKEASNQVECIIDTKIDLSNEYIIKNVDFIFENPFYSGYINNSFGFESYIYNSNQEPIIIHFKNNSIFNLINYYLLNQTHTDLFQLDEYSGVIKSNFKNKFLFNKYSFIIYAKYNSLITLTRLNILINQNNISEKQSFQSIYEFKLYIPFVNNYTIGYLNKTNENLSILNEYILPMISIENYSGRLFVKNRTLLLTNGNFYDFLIQNEYLEIIRIQIIILTPIEPIYECRLNYLNNKQLIGFIEILNDNQTNSICYRKKEKSFYLLNYNNIFSLNREHGLLYYKNKKQIINEDLLILIQIDNSRCLITIDKSISDINYLMIRNQSQLQNEIKEEYNIEKSSGKIKLLNGTLIDYEIIPSKSPIFSKKSYELSLNLSNINNRSIYIGQISAESYNINRSHIIYQFINRNKHFILNIDNGIIEYIPNEYYNKTIEQFQIIARDLIYQQNTTTNLTIHIFKPEITSFTSLIYDETVSEILPPGSIIFQPNISITENVEYSLKSYHSNLFKINPTTGQVILLNYLSDKFYSFKIHISPINKILIIKLTINNYNNHHPKFQNLPLNLSLSTSNIFLTKLSAYDFDLIDNQNLKYYLLDKTQEKIFSLNQTNGILTLKENILLNKFYQLNLGVSDGLYLTKNYLQIHFLNYSKHSPIFSSNEYIFHYDQSKEILGQINAHDSDVNDEVFYELYLQPNEIEIDSKTGVIKMIKKYFSKPILEFFASAKDLAKRIVYTKIQIIYPIQPKFNSNLYIISLIRNQLILPLEIFQFEIVDLFNQRLNSGRFQIKNQTNLFEINENKLILKTNLIQTDNYLLNINAYWKNFIIQTSIQILFVDELIKFEKDFYQFTIDKILLKENYSIEKFNINNSILNIISTPLTRNDCHENFYIKKNELYFKTFPILSDLCFFEIQLINNNIIYSSTQIKISFSNLIIKPKFSSNIYQFYFNNKQNLFRVFALSSNKIQYQLETNPYGLFINQINGILSFKYYFNLNENIQLNVYAIDEKNNLNDTALIIISINQTNTFEIPRNSTEILLCPNIPILLDDQSLPGTVIQDISYNNNISNNYYILSGDEYGLFAINNLGQLYLTSPILNQTIEDYFQLIILISSSSLSYCRTNISINRTPKWSYFICPAMPIQWMIEEESPIGTIIGTVKETLLLINNNFSKLIDKISFKLNNQNNDAQSFLLNFQTGLITSNSRLDYEQKIFYLFNISLEPIELNCSITILIKLININDNPIMIDTNSLVYNITENNSVPFYVGRIKLIDIDKLFSFDYEFYLKNSSKQITIDQTSGAIILNDQLDREYHGSELQYEFILIDNNNKENNLTNKLIIYINDINDHGPKFDQDYYFVNISKSIRINSFIFQINATSDDPIDNGNFTYYLINPSEYFSIDEFTGIIRLKKSLPLIIKNFTLNIEVLESGINLTDETKLFITILNDDFYFNYQNNCFIEENQIIGTNICTIGINSNDFIYELIDSKNNFQIFEHNGTIINKKIFDYEKDQHEYNLTIIVKDRENQSVPLSSLNLTIYVRNIDDNYPEFVTKNLTTIIYFYYPLINTIVYKIEAIDKDETNITFEIINNTFYRFNPILNNTIELILMKAIVNNEEDNLIIRIWNNQKSFYLDLHICLMYFEYEIFLPKIIPQTIDGYINFEENITSINFGPLFIQNNSEYKFIHYNLISNEYFSLKQISNNQTELYFNSFQQSSHQQKHRLLQFQIELTVIAINQSIPKLNFSNNLIIYSPPSNNLKTHLIDIHLWSMDREMLDRTLSLIINLDSQSTYQQFIIESLPLIREYLAQIIGVNIRHVHIYTFDFKSEKQIELLISIIRYPSRLRPPRYIHKKLLYNALKNSSHLLEKILHIKSIENILINQCHLKSCQNNGRCTSQIKLNLNQYNYFYYQTYQRLIPKYQWNIKCLCLNYYYGQYCQFKQDYQSPCLSNPCSALERCIDESSTLYTCQCIDEPCYLNEVLSENSLNCININSPTCRDSSNALTFDGYSLVRMNLTINLTKHFNLTLTFRTEITQGKLISINDKIKQNFLIIQINNGYINFELNKKILFQINDIIINDGLWHKIYFSIDYTLINNNYYYLIRLDDVFSNQLLLSNQIFSKQFQEFLIGNDFHGCLGNLTINNQIIYLQKQENNLFIEHIGTNNGCQLAEIETRTLRQYDIKDDICSLYHPCYYGGICSTNNSLSFTCNCLKPRFTGRQCQRDLQPCQSHPCLFNEQCITSSSASLNITYSCISSLINLPMSTKNPLYLGIIVLICIGILFLLLILSLIIYCQQKQKDKKRKIQLNNDKPLVSAPLLIQNTSPNNNNNNNTIESPMQTLLKFNQNSKQGDTMNNFNDKQNNNQLNKSLQSIDKQQYQSYESLNNRRTESKGYSTIGRMNIPPDNFLTHYNSIDNDNTRIPLVDPQSTDLFDFPSSPTKYFNGHHNENSNNYQIRVNSLSNLTEKLAEQNDIELTHSSNDSSNNEQTLLTSPISNGERKRSLFNLDNIRSSTSSLQKAPVYAKIIKTSSKTTNGGMGTIERLRLSGSPLRLLSSSPTYARTTSFLKGNSSNDNDIFQISSSSSNKNNKINSTSWKLNPRKLDSLKAKRNSRQIDDDDDDTETNNETSQLTINRIRHASESDLTKGHNGKKQSKLSSFFQTEV